MEDQKIDRRVQRTRQLLQRALLDLTLQKNYDKITVQNIIDEANLGRSTFYAHYLDKDDLMESTAARLGDELGRHFSNAGNTKEVMLPSLALFEHAYGQHDLYKALLGGRGIEIVTEAIEDGLQAHARAHFEQALSAGQRLTVPMEILIVHLAGSLQNLLTWWLDNDTPYPPKQMNEMFMQLVTGGVEAVIEEK